MSLIVTPSELERRAELYHQLGALLIAGVPVLQSLEQLQRHPPAWTFRRMLATAHADIVAGETFTTAWTRSDADLPKFDAALIAAGEKSGRLESCLQMLAQYYRDRAQLARQVISSTTYPLLLIHMVVLIFPTSMLNELVWQGKVIPFIAQKVMVLGPLYVVVLGFIILLQNKRHTAIRGIVERVLNVVPLLGSARRKLALARLSAALEALIRSGVPVISSWPLAAAASGFVQFHDRVDSWARHIEMGQTPADMLRRSPEFPEMFSNMYASGEVSGQLDDTLHRLYVYYQEEGTRGLKLFSQVATRLLYFGIAGLIAWKVVSFYMGYFSQLGEVMK